MAVQYSITLVHGTFARKAAWTRESSRLCGTLREKLGASVDFHPFTWSGRNSPSARIKAAERLRLHLRQTTDAHPRAAHYVIAHSHGGNIALYALQDEELQRRIRGVVCLSTPFLHVRNRQLPRTALDYAAWILAFFVSILLFVGAAFFDRLEGWPDWVKAIHSWFVLFLAFNVGLSIVYRVQSRWMAMADVIRERHCHPRLPPGKLLILRTVGDEASAVLGTAQFVNWILGWSTSRIYRLHDFRAQHVVSTRTARWIITAVLFVLIGGLKYSSLLVVCASLGLSYLLSVLVVAMIYHESVIFALLGVATVVLFLPAIILISLLLLLPFGLQFAVSNILLEISAEPAPVGNWTIHQLRGGESAYERLAEKAGPAQAETAPARDAASLMHSSVYDDPDAISRIASWIVERRGRYGRQRR